MPDSPFIDVNAVAAGALRDMAALQDSPYAERAYARAATAVLGLEQALTTLVEREGSLPRMPQVGPSSVRIIREVLTDGQSSTAEALIDERGQRAAIERQRAWRTGFLSRATALEILALAGNELRARYQADLQMHSTWSDGRESIQAMAEGCLARGYTFAAMTDHAGGLSIARGLSSEERRRQRAEIASVNATLAGAFVMLAGVEANILADGAIDVPPDDVAALEVVVAAPHSGLRSEALQTARLVTAVTTPGVHVLGHPRGRTYGARPGVQADWPAVFAAAARHGVAVELDGDPSRQDLDCTVALQALDAGCLFAVDSDAHAVGELWYTDIALAHARLAGVPPERIVNCWPIDRFRAWLTARRQGAAS